MTGDKPPVQPWLSALAHSQHRLAEVTATIDEVTGPSYASGWSIAQVLSHLGSGAEIFSLFLRAGLQGEPAPEGDQFRAIWDRWDAKSPGDQVSEALAADAAFVDRLEGLDPTEQQSWQLALFGTDHDLVGLARLRLGEHALHTWDVAVTRDDNATVAADAVDLLVDTLSGLAGRVAKPSPLPSPFRTEIITTGPDRQFVLRSDSETTLLQPVTDMDAVGRDRTVRLPAEALIRLVYGRLDPAHTPTLDADGVDIDVLRLIFPGF